MSIQYFLGANAATGFYSLYAEELSRQKNYLHIIKGGPGTGKSTYMKRIGQAAEAHGLTAEYILCSGDPDSLDGVMIPTLGQAWIDGTAPHSLDSVQFGLDSDYVNLGQFCKTPLSCNNRDSVSLLREKYQNCYRKAYATLSAAASVAMAAEACRSKSDEGSSTFLQEIQDILRQRIHEFQEKHSDISHAEDLPKISVRHCFLSAINCQGHFILDTTINELCNLNYVICDVSISRPILLQVAGIGARLDQNMLLCHNPRNPASLDAVVFPALSLSFVSTAYTPENANTLSPPLSCALPSSSEERDRESMLHHMEGKLMDSAYSLLAQAKAYHDDMEQFYMEAMDYPALEAFTKEGISKLFP